MYSQRRQLPVPVSSWINKDVQVKKFNSNIGAIPADARDNIRLSRQFYAHLQQLSCDRYRKIIRCEHAKTKFMEKQQAKAETTLPGLLPYIESIKHDKKAKPTMNRNGRVKSPSLKSYMSSSTMDSDDSFESLSSSHQKQSRVQIIELKKSPERTNRTNQFPNLKNQYHARRNDPKLLTVKDLFNDFNKNSSAQNGFSKHVTPTTNDKRFRRLINLFSEVHEIHPSNTNTIKNIIQSNLSLQSDEKQSAAFYIQNTETIDFEDHQRLLSGRYPQKSEIYFNEVPVH